MNTKLMFSAFSAFLCSYNLAMAGSVTDCDSALIISTYNKIESSKSDWRMAVHVDEQTYSKLKTEVGASGAIYGVPVGANYGQFKENTKNYSTDQSSSYSEEQFRNVSWTGLSADTTDAYKSCIRSRQGGLVLIPDRATDSDVSFRILYNITGGSPNPLSVTWTGEESGNNSLPKAISAGSDGRVVIIKRPTKTSTLAINGENNTSFSDSVILTPIPEPFRDEMKFSSRCEIKQSANPGAVSPGNYFSWICPRMRAGTYQATLSVVPSPPQGRPQRLGWSADLQLKGQDQDQSIALNTTSGSTIDAGANVGIGTSFESQGNIFDIRESGVLPIFRVRIGDTYWHGDFSHPSNEPIFIPQDVAIVLERL